MAIGDIVLFNGQPAEVLSEGRTLEVRDPSPEKLTPEVMRRLGQAGATMEKVLAELQMGDTEQVLAR